MRRITRTTALAVTALSLSLGLAACGSDDDSDAAASGSSASEMESPSESPSDSPMAEEAAAGSAPFGEGCAAVPTSGPGSVESMSGKPVATAAAESPLLTTLTAAIEQAGLAKTLDSAEALTVFAPTDDAFAAIPKKDLNALLADQEALTQVLTHHVVEGQLGPDQVGGEHQTLNGDTVEVTGEGEDWTVGDEMSAVVCGNVPTANATLYVVDTVLMP